MTSSNSKQSYGDLDLGHGDDPLICTNLLLPFFRNVVWVKPELLAEPIPLTRYNCLVSLRQHR